MIDVKDLPQPFNKSIQSAVFKSCATDFIVNELLTMGFSGEGEHLWLKITKTNINTAYLATELAKWAKIPARDVGYSGLKDRKGVTTQWFSLRIPKKNHPEQPLTTININTHESIELLESHWHNKKLNKGTHKANEFIVTLREVQANKTQVEEQLHKIEQCGLPNYFGQQRFGIDGKNLEKFLHYVETIQKSADCISAESHVKSVDNDSSQKRKKRSKNRNSTDKNRAILISSARSAIFNQILAKRVLNNTWNKALKGEVLNLAGSSSIFIPDTIDYDITRRIDEFDIHPTGCLWGIENKTKENNDKNHDEDTHDTTINNDEQKTSNKLTSMASELEKEVVTTDEMLLKLANGLDSIKIKPARRSLRLLISRLTWQWLESDTNNLNTIPEIHNKETHTLQLSFTLPTGSYATNLINSLVFDEI